MYSVSRKRKQVIERKPKILERITVSIMVLSISTYTYVHTYVNMYLCRVRPAIFFVYVIKGVFSELAEDIFRFRAVKNRCTRLL